MFNYFRKKVIGDSLSKISGAFSSVDEDIKHIQQWISHLHNKSEELNKAHSEHISLTRKDINGINKWLQYLHSHNTELHKYVKESTNILLDLQKNHNKILERLEKLEQGQLGTLQRTFKGHLKDMSLESKDISKQKKGTEIKVIDKSSLTGSQLELVNIFYHADRPLGYGDIAKLVRKKKKSIRNLIYEIRDKGIRIESKPIGIRRKGFYLSKEEKIKVSGR